MPIPSRDIVVLITGANSGVGYGIASRFIVEFFDKKGSDSVSLTVCLAIRSQQKAAETISRLSEFTKSKLPPNLCHRLNFHHVSIDLCSLHSITKAAVELLGRYQRIHYVFCNAAVVPFVRIDWAKAIMQVTTDFVKAMTNPNYKVQGIGWLVNDKWSDLGLEHDAVSVANTSSYDLGAVFAANVFGHYYLVHEIMRSLHASTHSTEEISRIIWIGSIESDPLSFDVEDFQGMKSGMSYESSKTLTDILVLGSYLTDNKRLYESYTTAHSMVNNEATTAPPIMLLAHPGIVSTNIVAIPWWQTQAKLFAFWICRLVGSPWHCIDPYVGANAPVWVALTPHVDLVKGRKWGSACDWNGKEIVLETSVDVDTKISDVIWSKIENLRKAWKSRMQSLNDMSR